MVPILVLLLFAFTTLFARHEGGSREARRSENMGNVVRDGLFVCLFVCFITITYNPALGPQRYDSETHMRRGKD